MMSCGYARCIREGIEDGMGMNNANCVKCADNREFLESFERPEKNEKALCYWLTICFFPLQKRCPYCWSFERARLLTRGVLTYFPKFLIGGDHLHIHHHHSLMPYPNGSCSDGPFMSSRSFRFPASIHFISICLYWQPSNRD